MRRRTLFLGTAVVCAALCAVIVVVLSNTEVQLRLDAWRGRNLDLQIAEARQRSDADAVALLRTMLRGNSIERESAIVRLDKLQFAPEVVTVASSELVDILEKDMEAMVRMATNQLVRIGPLADEQIPRLLEMAKHGDPVWRRFNACYVLGAMKLEDPAVITAINEVRQLDEYKLVHSIPDVRSPDEQSHTPEPATRPGSSGDSSPPAR